MGNGTTLVTGATGFAGGHLLDRLGRTPSTVAWHRPGGRGAGTASGVHWQAVDITDRDAVLKAVEAARPSRLFHLAGAPNVGTSWDRPVDQLRTNALGTHHVLDAVGRAAPDCRVLVVSSAQIYRPADEPVSEESACVPANPYGLSKLAQDQLALRVAEHERLDVVVARPFNHIGPGQQPGFVVADFARQISRIEAGLSPPVLGVGNLDARRDITDVRDVVAAYVLLMDRGTSGRAYNVCSGRVWRIGDLVTELLRLARTAIRVEVDERRLRPRDTQHVGGNNDRIRTELGWSPSISIDETLRDTLDWWRVETRAGR